MGGSSSSEVTVGYKYYLGIHMVLCHGPVDAITKIQVDKRDAWIGSTSGGRVNINAPGLFGGEDREGGVAGAVDIEMGEPTQPRNDYLQARLGTDIPAFRGVVSAVLRQVYLGINPYLKPWSFRARRIQSTSNGEPQWFPSTAGIVSSDRAPQVFTEDFSGGKSGYSEYSFPGANDPSDGLGRYSVDTSAYGKCLTIDPIESNSYVSHPSIYKLVATKAPLQRVTFKVRLNSLDDEDNGLINLRDENFAAVFSFGAARDKSVDSLQRPNVSFNDISGQYGNPIGPGPLPLGIWHQVFVEYDASSSRFYCSVRNLETGEIFGEVTTTVGGRNDVSSVHFEADCGVGKTAGSSSWDDVTVIVGDVQIDMNPAHIIRECLTDSLWGMGYLDQDIDDVSFSAAADTLYQEGMGISLLWDRQMPIEDFIQEIIRHINATLYVDRVTGKFTLKLIRNDYDEQTLLTLDEGNIEKVSDYNRVDPGDAVNSVTVVYWDAWTGEKASITADDVGLIQAYGSVVNTTVQYPGFTNQSIAARAASRDLQSLSSPLLSATILANREASGLNIGDVFKFEWPEYHEGYVLMRVTQIAFGDGKTNRVKITATEDVFALPESATTAEEDNGWEEPGGPPLPPPDQLVFEAPYYELVQQLGQTDIDTQLQETPEIGYLQVAASRPSNGFNARMWVDSGAGFEDGGPLDFCPSGDLSSAVGMLDTSFTILNGEDLEEVEVGTHGQVDEELFVVEAIDPETGELTVGRGILDTVPKPHAAGSRVLFWDAYSASNQTEYVAGEQLDVRVLTNSSQGTLPLYAGVTESVTIDQRAFRPYRPAGLTATDDDAQGYMEPPDSWYPVYPVNISWVERNRVQETAGNALTWTDPGITPEAGTDYRVTVEAIDENGAVVGQVDQQLTGGATSYQLSETTIGSTWAEYPYMRVTVTAVRDSLDSFQSPSIEFRGPFREPTELSGVYKSPAPPEQLGFQLIP